MSAVMSLGTVAWVDVPEGSTVLVPLGSTEQHGPHLPFDTDTAIANSAAHASARALGHAAPGHVDVVVAPAIAYGASGEHQSFPGTVSIGHEALHLLLIELVRSLSTWAGRIILINGHGGNVATVSAVVAQMVAEGHDVAWVACQFG